MKTRYLICFVLVWVLAIPSFVSSKEPYKIGAVFSVTGPASFLGDSQKKTVLMIQEWINQGGGVNGHPLEVIIEDSKSDETQAFLSAKKLLEKDQISIFIGSSTTGESMAIVPIMEKATTPMISCAAALSIVTPEDEMKRIIESPRAAYEKPLKQRHWIFKTPQPDTAAVEAIYEYMKKKGISKAALLTVTAAYGDFGRQEMKRIAPRFGITIVADERYGPKDIDMVAQLTRIKGTDAQAIINWSVGPTAVVVTKNWKDLQFKIPLYQSHGFGAKRNIELAGGAAEGVLTPQARIVIAEKLPDTHPQKPILLKYKKEYEGRYKEPVGPFGGLAWDAFYLAVDALKAVGPGKAKIRDHLENKIKNWPGVGGIFNMSPADHTGVGVESFEMIVVEKGDWAFAK